MKFVDSFLRENPPLRVSLLEASVRSVLSASAASAPVCRRRQLLRRRTTSPLVLLARVAIWVIRHTPLTCPARIVGLGASDVRMPRRMTVHACVWRCVHHEADGDFLVILQLHSIATYVANVIEPVHLHPLQSGVAYVVFILDRAHFSDADGVVCANPLRAEAAVVVGASVGNILRLADEPLPAGEREDVELFHGSGTLTIFIYRMNPFLLAVKCAAANLELNTPPHLIIEIVIDLTHQHDAHTISEVRDRHGRAVKLSATCVIVSDHRIDHHVCKHIGRIPNIDRHEALRAMLYQEHDSVVHVFTLFHAYK